MIISKKVLGQKLKEMYENAPHNKKALMVHLFGIKFANVIRSNGYSAREIVETAGINGNSYQVELNKGINLSQYVDIKKNMDNFDL
ncbi:MAG: hypothetical protein K2O04_01910 [Clostridiales bacterium]|nr:hypothetical protein [Clostridiales bacterium]